MTEADGTTLTWFQPADHRWHRALWFTWKKINGIVYWEENAEGLSPAEYFAASYGTRPPFQ